MLAWFACWHCWGMGHHQPPAHPVGAQSDPRIRRCFSMHRGPGFFMLGAVFPCGDRPPRPSTPIWGILAVMHCGQLGSGSVFPGAPAQLFRSGGGAGSAIPMLSSTPSIAWCPNGASIRSGLWRRSRTIIASQAVISGAFSITRQAVQLAICRGCRYATPRSRRSGRSTYRASTAPCLSPSSSRGRVPGHRTISARAYGIAVSGMMAITTGSRFCYMRSGGWSLAVQYPSLPLSGIIDLTFFSANL